ncbi:MAG: hypothetical protein B7Y41_11895 [Hydrogenophilales bacterium 28-61-23]|nr:MAG: hypothetical protein B7Y41_11895 [Hydrogenophilales bacterium 28-61-23]
MKLKHLALALLPLLIDATHAAAPDLSPQTSADPVKTETQRFADRCTDFTANGWAFKAPRNFLKWLDVFTDPGIYLEFANRSLDPQSYVRSLTSLLDPATPRNYLEWSNPEIYNRWAQAAAQPEFYTAVNSILFDPGRMMRWAMLPIDGRAWSVAGNAANPNTWLKWLNAPADPKTQELFAKAANPETVQRWLDAVVDPNNTPWFNAPATTYGAQPTKLPGLGKRLEAAKIKL